MALHKLLAELREVDTVALHGPQEELCKVGLDALPELQDKSAKWHWWLCTNFRPSFAK